jgi:hypothetical protein
LPKGRVGNGAGGRRWAREGRVQSRKSRASSSSVPLSSEPSPGMRCTTIPSFRLFRSSESEDDTRASGTSADQRGMYLGDAVDGSVLHGGHRRA